MTAEPRKMLAPRAQPRDAAGAHDSRRPSTLPDVMMSDQVRRLALASAIAGGLWTNGVLLDRVLIPLVVVGQYRSATSDLVIEIAAIAISAAMFLYACYSKHSPKTKGDVGLGFMLANALGIALLNTWDSPPTGHMMALSWISILILVFGMVAPANPRKMLIASLAAAAMDPLAVWVAHLRGFEVPSVAFVLVMYIPNYICAIIATLPSRVLHRVGRKLREAQELGSYQLIERLGAGGMGEVWRAEHNLLARSAAVKLVRPEVLGMSNEHEARTVLARFEREAQATAALSSPHTINLFDFGVTEEGTFYYVMELLLGRDMESLIREFGPVPADRAIYLLRQVCHSLADAHARGLVHRDIKPANIYLCRMGLEYDFVKVLDFGLVKSSTRKEIGETTLTSPQMTTGTPAYMAPEVILGEEVDRRADVYSFGCVAYYLLTGRLVFEAETPMKMLLQHVQAPPVPPSARSELTIPPEIDALVLACLEKDPDKRPQHAEELLLAACGCSCDAWDQPQAKRWWQTHLPDLTGPLTLGERDLRSGRQTFVAR